MKSISNEFVGLIARILFAITVQVAGNPARTWRTLSSPGVVSPAPARCTFAIVESNRLTGCAGCGRAGVAGEPWCPSSRWCVLTGIQPQVYDLGRRNGQNHDDFTSLRGRSRVLTPRAHGPIEPKRPPDFAFRRGISYPPSRKTPEKGDAPRTFPAGDLVLPVGGGGFGNGGRSPDGHQ